MTALLKFILFRLWPIFIPLVLYVIWLIYQKKIKKNLEASFFGQHFKLVIISTVIITLISFIVLFAHIKTKDEYYLPSRVEGGKITPSQTITNE